MNEQKIRVLLVEDDEDDYVVVRDLLKALPDWEAQLDWAQSCQAALERAEAESYDICFVDYRLGEENGIDLMRRLIGNGLSCPVVIATGKGTREIDAEAMGEGAADYIEKSSLNPDTLERCIRYNIERNRVLSQLRSARNRLRELSVKLIEAQERERRLIARELHDSIGSGMTAIKFALESKIESMKNDPPSSTGIPIEKILSMVQDAMEETRRISAKLRPSILDDMGLVQTIGWMCRDFEALHSNIRIRQEIGIEESDVPESLKTVIYRILQEALNNVAKHSGADRVDLSVRKTDRRLEVTVRDNGRGFDREGAGSDVRPTGGTGLEGMQDRAEFTEGTFEIDSNVGAGTTVRAAWTIFPPALFQ